jgi:hypothetical protein
MDNLTKSQLNTLDQSGLYCSADFHRERALAQLFEVKTQIHQTTGVNLDLDDYVQDATFVAELSKTIALPSNNAFITAFSIRFSAFDRLCALRLDKTVFCYTSAQIDAFRSTLNASGYKVLDKQELDGPYDGVHQQWIGRSWYDRFFDYI